MNVLVVSDSHGLTNELKEIKERHQTEVDFFLHCGDSELESDDPYLSGYQVVRGNCDFHEAFPNEWKTVIDGKSLLLTHGHLYSVKTSLLKLTYHAKELGVRIVCFGHSHQLGAEMIDDILFINPGSIRQPRGRTEKTYVILKLEENNVHFHVYDVRKGEIPELSTTFQLQ